MRPLLLAVLCALAGPPLTAQTKEVINLGSANAPFSTAVKVGNVLYLSGQIGTVPGQGLIAGGISAETRQTLENIKRTLEQLDSSMGNAFKCTVFLADIGDYAAMNTVYREFFPTDPPARSTVAGSGLALNARVEIECMAVAN
jgi:2-iminobutanoate/2-iminopropanoate deaminase